MIYGQGLSPFSMPRRTIQIAMNGVTGRMGRNQHLIRSILALQKEGGLQLKDGTWLYPEPVLIGRDQRRLQELAGELKVARWTTDLSSALSDRNTEIYFDAQITSERATALKAAIEAGKHIYCEKPVADNLATAMELAHLAKVRGVKNGVVQDKLFLPGIRKLQRLVASGFFGRILSVRGEFGYWVFDGYLLPAQRPSWNYRSEDGGGIVHDMFCHWRYVLEALFGPIQSVMAIGATHIPARSDESGRSYEANADDAAYAIFELEKGIIAQINSSWCVRVYRDELFSLQVDGTLGSAVAGLRHCKAQPRVCTPRVAWNPDLPDLNNFFADWNEVPDNQEFDNAFKTQWELFLRHVVEGTPFPHSLLDGAKGVQLAEAGMQSWRERRWIDLPQLT
jgi:predicted dehydrogenase